MLRAIGQERFLRLQVQQRIVHFHHAARPLSVEALQHLQVVRGDAVRPNGALVDQRFEPIQVYTRILDVALVAEDYVQPVRPQPAQNRMPAQADHIHRGLGHGLAGAFPPVADLADHIDAVPNARQRSAQPHLGQAVGHPVRLRSIEQVDSVVVGAAHGCPGGGLVDVAPLPADVPGAAPDGRDRPTQFPERSPQHHAALLVASNSIDIMSARPLMVNVLGDPRSDLAPGARAD